MVGKRRSKFDQNLDKVVVAENLKQQLENEKSSFEPHWRDLNDHILPRRGRFYTQDTNRGERRNLKIIDSTATFSARTLRSGMTSGITSPARPWFKLSHPLREEDSLGPVGRWLDNVAEDMRSVFLRSNLYSILPIIYGDIGVFATAAMLMEEDFDKVVRFKDIPIGSYSIGSSDGVKIDIFIREFRMTVRQIIEEFAEIMPDGKPDLSKFDESIQSQYQNDQTEAWYDITHIIWPNRDYDPRKLDSKHKLYSSMYYTYGSINNFAGKARLPQGLDDTSILRESGFDFFPVLVPRWETTGEDYWGTECPGMVALGDIKQLQFGERKIAKAMDKTIDPPMVGSPTLKFQSASLLPGDITYADESSGRTAFRPAHEIRFPISEVENKQAQVRQRIQRAFFEDLFLMLASSDRRQITATEIEERKEEKLLALGPVLEQLNQDLLDPLIDNTFTIMQRQGLLDPPPEAIQGQDIKVEYISIMAQAQKSAGVGILERFAGFSGQMLGIYPELKMKIDQNKFIDRYADDLGVPPEVLRSTEEVEAMEKAQAQAAQQQAQLDQIQQVAATAKDAASIPSEGVEDLQDISNAGALV